MKNIIWSNKYDYVDDIVEDIRSEYPDKTEDEILDLAYSMNEDDFHTTEDLLNIQLDNNLVMFGELGLWYGNRIVYKVLKDSNVNGIFSGTTGDYITWYTENGEVKCEDIHHDGTNHYTYRVLKPGVTPFEFEEEAYDGVYEAVEKYTEPIGHYVSNVFGGTENE